MTARFEVRPWTYGEDDGWGVWDNQRNDFTGGWFGKHVRIAAEQVMVQMDRDHLTSENERLRKGLEHIREMSDLEHRYWQPGRDRSEWREGYITALSSMSLKAMEHLDPEAWAEHEDRWRQANGASDRKWFEVSGHCGHCGQVAGWCACTPDDPCECGPHERSTADLPCGWCRGTGVALKATESVVTAPTNASSSDEDRTGK